VLVCVGAGLALADGHTKRAGHAPRVARALPAMCGLTTTVPKYKHVIVVFFENHSYQQIIGSPSAPTFNSVANTCGLATSYHNITHPSLPEYLAATDGGTLSQVTTPFVSDCTPSTECESNSNNIFRQLSVRKRLWKGYNESMPSKCDRSNVGFYAPRHNPAVYYTDLTDCASRDVALGTTTSSPLLHDFSSEKTAPAYAWVTPNLCDDMHNAAGCPGASDIVVTGDNWLKLWLPKLVSTKVYRAHDTVIFLSFDEGAGGSGGESCATNTTDQSCRVAMIVVAPSVKHRKRVARLLNHYSLLKGSEDLLALPELNQAKTATDMLKPFHLK
jgi:phosphatidylinositol-3-phosphatase